PFHSVNNTTSIADIDLDGDLDAVVRGVAGGSGQLYVWDMQTPTLVANIKDGNYPFETQSFNYPAIADLTGDGRPEIICRTGSSMVAYSNDLKTALWTIPIQEFAGQATQSVFDFNEDGFPEVVYRDNRNLQIIGGRDGQLLASYPCGSGTNAEMPSILDIDADGEAEIACECGGNIYVFGSAGKPWANTRKVWNQFLSFNVHVNDDLSIPIVQQDHGKVGDRSVMNAFFKQTVIPKELADCEEDSCIFAGQLDLGPDLEICDNSVSIFNAGAGFSTYRWSDQTTDSIFTADGPGKFWVEVTDSCDNVYSDTVEIRILPQTQVNLGADIRICRGTSLTLSGGQFDQYQWFSEGLLPCNDCESFSINPDTSVQYILLATSSQGCYSIDTLNIIISNTGRIHSNV
ncbi:MAG: FG-GAP-like repeat-containing protein, partial [Pseudomonadota bacterium]